MEGRAKVELNPVRARLDPLDNDAGSQKEKTASHYDRGSTPGGIENPLQSHVSTSKGPLSSHAVDGEWSAAFLGRWIGSRNSQEGSEHC